MKTLKAIQTRCVIWLIGLVVFSCCSTLSASAAPVDETMVLKQKCTGIGGVYTVYLGKDNLRIESPALIIFAQAPKWAVTVLSPKKKIYFQSDYKSCLKHLYTARTPYSTIADSSSLKWRPAQGAEIAGLATQQWCNDSPGKSGVKPSSVKYWTLPGSQFAPQCAEIMATFYGIPAVGHGIPLRLVSTGTGSSFLPLPSRHYDDDSQQQQQVLWLDTTVMKKMPASAALFAIPKGCKPTKSYVDIAVQGDAHNPDNEFIMKDLFKHPEALFESR